MNVNKLIELIDEHADARERLRRAPDDPNDDEHKFALAAAVDSWRRLLDERYEFRIDEGANQ